MGAVQFASFGLIGEMLTRQYFKDEPAALRGPRVSTGAEGSRPCGPSAISTAGPSWWKRRLSEAGPPSKHQESVLGGPAG
jgi:hypothetical protein